MDMIKRIKDSIGRGLKVIKRLYETQRKRIILDRERRKLANDLLEESLVAEYALRTAKARMDVIHDIITFSERIAATLGEFEQKKANDLSKIQEKDVDISIKQAKAQMALYEAKLSELQLKNEKIGG